jgi:putative copper export protein
VSLRRSIQLEIAAALLILLVTASFTSLVGPPR